MVQQGIKQQLETFINEWNSPAETLLVHTSGSTGKPKPLWVEKRRMAASARATCQFLGLKAGDSALLCMSLNFIAGKMMVVRALVCGLRLIAVEPSGHPLASLNEVPTFAAMVPMQVFNTLQIPAERRLLEQTKHLIIGGGAISKALEDELRSFPNAVWSTYGMTETLSHIALRRVSGQQADRWYSPFPHVNVSLNADDCLVINAPEVCASPLTTNDRAELAPDGRRFRIIGRRDNVICSGGIKIQIEEIESLLAPFLAVPFLITKHHDEKFGERVVLLTTSPDVDFIRSTCQQHLPKYWQPRQFITVSALPTTATGKPARKQAELLAEQYPL